MKLTSNEMEVLRLTGEGWTSTEIGEEMDISPKTVDTYRGRIRKKLGLDLKGFRKKAFHTALTSAFAEMIVKFFAEEQP